MKVNSENLVVCFYPLDTFEKVQITFLADPEQVETVSIALNYASANTLNTMLAKLSALTFEEATDTGINVRRTDVVPPAYVDISAKKLLLDNFNFRGKPNVVNVEPSLKQGN